MPDSPSPVDLDLRLVRYFAVVADHRHCRAAAALSVAQPSLSRQIRRLEQQLGARLPDRTPQGSRLTEAGGGPPAPGQGAAALGRPGRGPCPGRRAANPHLDLRPDLTTVPLHGVEPSHVVLATRAGDHSRLVVAFRKSAQARVTAPSPAQAASAPPSRAGE